MSVQIEASTVLTKKTFQNLILITLNDTLEKDENYYLNMAYMWYGQSYNSNKLFVSFLSKEDIEEIVAKDFRRVRDFFDWERQDSYYFSMDKYDTSAFVYKAHGDEKFLLLGSPKVTKFIRKKDKVKKSVDYWGCQIHALRLLFSHISLYKMNVVDSLSYHYKIGQHLVDEIRPIRAFPPFGVVDSLTIQGFADTVGFSDSLNKMLAMKRSFYLKEKYQKRCPAIPIHVLRPKVLAATENRKTEVKIYRRIELKKL